MRWDRYQLSPCTGCTARGPAVAVSSCWPGFNLRGVVVRRWRVSLLFRSIWNYRKGYQIWRASGASLRDAKGERILRATPSFQHERRCRGKLPPHHGSRRNGSDAAPGRTRRSAGTLQSSIHSTQAAHHRTPSLPMHIDLFALSLSKPATLILARTARMHPARLARLPTFTRSARCCPLSHSFPTASLLSTVSPYPVPSAGTPRATTLRWH